MNTYEKILEKKELEIDALKAAIVSLSRENEELKAKLGAKEIEERLSKIDSFFDINGFNIKEEALKIKALSRYLNHWKCWMENQAEKYKEQLDNNSFEFFEIMKMLNFAGGQKDDDPGRKKIALCMVLLEGHGISIKYPEKVIHGKTEVKWYPKLVNYIELYRKAVEIK